MSIEARNISSGYWRDIDIIHEVSLKAEKSKITSIIGPNGAGKSTIIKTMYGFLKPRQGSIYHNDEEITDLKPHQMLMRGIAYIPQARNIFPFLTVYENLKMGAWLFRNDHPRVEQSIKRIYDLFPILKEKAGERAVSLSGGQQKMLEIGRSLVSDPGLFLVDEPTAGLAPIVAARIYVILEDLRKLGYTILMVDQNVRQAISSSDYVYVINLGKKEREGPKEKFESEMTELIRSWI
jgi:branched-chain amino acid transport system ATP-binding protein